MNYINGSELAGKRFVKLENGDLREVKEKFIPAIGESYHFINELGFIGCITNQNTEADRWAIKHHLVFRTEEECKDYRQFLKTLDEYTFEPDWDNGNQEKWAICFEHESYKISIDQYFFDQYQGNYFESEEKAKAFIKEVGEDRVKRYMFDVWE